MLYTEKLQESIEFADLRNKIQAFSTISEWNHQNWKTKESMQSKIMSLYITKLLITT